MRATWKDGVRSPRREPLHSNRYSGGKGPTPHAVPVWIFSRKACSPSGTWSWITPVLAARAAGEKNDGLFASGKVEGGDSSNGSGGSSSPHAPAGRPSCHRSCPPRIPAGPCGAIRRYATMSEASLGTSLQTRRVRRCWRSANRRELERDQRRASVPSVGSLQLVPLPCHR